MNTLMACGAEVDAREGWLERFLRAGPTLLMVGNAIRLVGETATLTLSDGPDDYPAEALAPATWFVRDLIRDGKVGRGRHSAATIVFQSDGRVDVNTTCRTGLSHYALVDDALTLTQTRYENAACGGAAAKLDRHIRNVIRNGTLTFAIYASRLQIQRGKDGFFAYKKFEQ